MSGSRSCRRSAPSRAFPFGGKYRIIDFALSNAVNSGLTDVAVLTQYAPRSLIDHIGVGRPWDLDRSRGGVTLLQPYLGRGRTRDWYRGTADAVLQNVEFIADRDPELVVILAGDHVYKMDYRPFIERHRTSAGGYHLRRAHGADRGCASVRDPRGRRGRLDHRLRGEAARSRPATWSAWASTSSAGPSCARSSPRTGRLRSRRAAGHGRRRRRVGAYHYGGYWQDVGTVESYWQTSLDLLSDRPGIDLYDRGWLIYTKSEERAPALIGSGASVTRSMVSHGCVIHGTVEHSILSPGVSVEAGAVVRDSIVMFDSVVGAGATVDRAILDKDCVVGSGQQGGGRRRPAAEPPGA